MKTASVSFRNVITITGKPHRITKLNSKLIPYVKNEQVIFKDITYKFKEPVLDTGIISSQASKGNKVFIYVSGDDVNKIKNKEYGFCTIDGIISSMKEYLDVNKMSISKAIVNIFNK